MFGFLKNKLKEWVDKAKDKLSSEEVNEEIKEEPKEEPKEKIKDKEKKDASKENIDSKSKKSKKITPKEKIEDIDNLEEIKEKSIEIIQESSKNKELNINSEDKHLENTLPPLEEPLNNVPENTENIVTTSINPELPSDSLTPETPTKKQNFLQKIFSKKESELKPNLSTNTETIKIEKPKETSIISKIKQSFIYKISNDDFNNLFDDLELLLLDNNVALEVTLDIKKLLSSSLIGKEIKKEELNKIISQELKKAINDTIVDPFDPLTLITSKKKKPFVILFFGINGTGKTTTIAKLTQLLKNNNLTVALAAADTFRAASIEQIQEHATKLNVPLIKHNYQSDPSAVGFDAIKYASANNIDVVLIDTAGRMHTKSNLLSEMEKIVRVTSPDLKIFVAESIAGNDATEQAKAFNEMIGIDGTILSKADIDEKGGTIISISHITKKPIFYLGTGQTYNDLKLFNKQEFIESLGL